eukprot:c46336_g1_i1 orf=33-254(+)
MQIRERQARLELLPADKIYFKNSREAQESSCRRVLYLAIPQLRRFLQNRVTRSGPRLPPYLFTHRLSLLLHGR